MTEQELTGLIVEVLSDIAPEVDAETLDPAEDLREELDLDSMDELNMITKLSEVLGIDIPERDYPQMRTLTGAVAYLSGRLAAHAG
jgi:acyl carrier protein